MRWDLVIAFFLGSFTYMLLPWLVYLVAEWVLAERFEVIDSSRNRLIVGYMLWPLGVCVHLPRCKRAYVVALGPHRYGRRKARYLVGRPLPGNDGI